MTVRRLACLLAFLSPALAAPVLIGFAQETPLPQPASISWRTNYNQAKKEAEDKTLPLLIDFYMFNCPPCEMLERTTFRDPKIVELLKDRCIPVKINGEVETMLRDHLRITSYPTLVLANAEGKILGTLVGGTEVSSKLLNSLEQIAPPVRVAATTPTPPVAPPMPDLLARDY